MDLIDYEKITRSEAAARKYLVSFCWKDGKRHCPKCFETRLYELAEGRLRCGRCRYTFHELSRRWVNFGGLSCQDWLRLIKLFELELPVSRMAPQLRLSYNTVYKAVTALRLAILAQALDSRQLLSGAFGQDMGFSGAGGGRIVMSQPGERQGSVPVFGLMEKEGWSFVDLLPNMQAEHVLHFHLNFKLRLVRLGNVVYTDRYRHYDALIFCADDSLPMQYLPARERGAYVDTVKGGFWGFAKARLRRFNGVTSRRFPLYLKELEFRFNHRKDDLFPLLVDSLCSLVPNYE